VKPGEDIEIVGLRKTIKATVTGVEMFHKLLDSGEVSVRARCRAVPATWFCSESLRDTGGRQHRVLASRAEARRRPAWPGTRFFNPPPTPPHFTLVMAVSLFAIVLGAV